MAEFFTGVGGSDGNDGSTYALRKLTIDAGEGLLTSVGDTLRIAPGTYRENVVLDNSGSSGNPITIVGDITGALTDGVGGLIRITGSDNDETPTRANCFDGSTARNFRTFRNLRMDSTTAEVMENNGGSDWIVEDCALQNDRDATKELIRGLTATQTGWIIRRCVFIGGLHQIHLSHSSGTADMGIVIENCLLINSGADGIRIDNLGDVDIDNITIMGAFDDGIDLVISVGTGAGQTVQVHNSIIHGCDGAGMESDAVATLVEDFNSFYMNTTDRTNVNVGSSSDTFNPQFAAPILLDGYVAVTPILGSLASWSSLAAITGDGNQSTDDLFGRLRPTVNAKISRGAIQYMPFRRDDSTIGGDTTVKGVLDDDGEFRVRLPVTAVSTTFKVDTYFETNYAGTKPTMTIKQDGQADQVTTAAGAVDTWETLTDTFTPAALPPWAEVVFKSSNTATSGSHKTWWRSQSVT